MEAHSPTVLCVDDETAILHSLRRIFLDEPWETFFARSGEEGLRLVSSHDVDLVLADFRMPGMDGVEFLKRVRAVRPDCLRIVLSGYADINLVITALNDGQIYKFLAKPWNDDELRHHVRKLLDHQRLNRENRRLTAELHHRVEEAAREREATEVVLRFARFSLESLPVPFVGVNGRGEVLVMSANARGLVECREAALERAIAEAVARARESPTGLAILAFAGGAVAATAGVEPLGLAWAGEQVPASAGARR
jgi:two-component system NtrC family sensor kinase